MFILVLLQPMILGLTLFLHKLWSVAKGVLGDNKSLLGK